MERRDEKSLRFCMEAGKLECVIKRKIEYKIQNALWRKLTKT
ncbi:hypothetical protein C818_01805 [Lachnospiraceae bacterium MD308]|nr:hypothetical protein C818_01805 [Lachnospiraceae bacterium MD308]